MNDQKDCELLLFEKSREQEIIVSRCMQGNKNIEDKYFTCPNCPNYRDSSKDFLLTEEDE